MNTATEFCQLVENRLGWVPPRGGWRAYVAEAGKVKRAIARNPSKYTWENLALAVELLAREKQSRTPVGVLGHVDRALDLALDAEHDIEESIRSAMAYEARRGDPAGWVVRFSRAVGKYREEALNEWWESVR